jgi:hypothetical protein
MRRDASEFYEEVHSKCLKIMEEEPLLFIRWKRYQKFPISGIGDLRTFNELSTLNTSRRTTPPPRPARGGRNANLT